MTRRTRNIFVQDLKMGDKIRIPSPEVRIISITALKRKYSTKMRGKVLEVQSVGLLWKGQTTTLLLSDEDKVQVAPRPSWGQQMASWWAGRKKAKKATKTAPWNTYKLDRKTQTWASVK